MLGLSSLCVVVVVVVIDDVESGVVNGINWLVNSGQCGSLYLVPNLDNEKTGLYMVCSCVGSFLLDNLFWEVNCW